jgi:hypothetical protein
MVSYSGKPLIQKLGIQSGFQLLVLKPPENYFSLLGNLPSGVHVGSNLRRPLDFIHLFVRDQKSFEGTLPKLKKKLAPGGMIWISWPKGASGLGSDLNDRVIRKFALAQGLVDVKVCSLDETWSGLKFVIPLKGRK